MNGAINNSVTSVTVTDGSQFPATGNFRVVCDTELMLCTARSSNTLTVTRGAEGSTAASHSDLAPITHIVTAGGLDRTGKDNDPLWGISRPAFGVFNDAGDTPLVASDFTDLNMSNASKTDQNGTIVLRHGSIASGEETCAIYRAAPSAPHTRIAAVQLLFVGNSGVVNEHFIGGMILRESSTGKFILFGVSTSAGLVNVIIGKLTSATNYSADLFAETTMLASGTFWLKVEDNNTNLIFSISTDGIEYIQLVSQSRTAFLAGGPDQVGVGSRHGNACPRDSLLRLVHWSKG